MKKTISLSIIALIILFACSRKENAYGQTDFTELDSLIRQFDNKWELEETGKSYWIGYTALMYKIALKKDTAIDRLVKYINCTENLEGKFGALFCLHLIGIDSKIAGRFHENFINSKARKALLSLVFQKDLTSQIVFLLARDPWPSDLPTLIKLLKKGSNRNLVNALFRYTNDETPFRQNISSTIDTFNVLFKNYSGTYSIGEIITIYKEKENEPLVKATEEDKNYKSGDIINVGGDDGYTSKVNQLNHRGDVFIEYEYSGRIVRKFIPNKDEINNIRRQFSCSIYEINNSKCEKVNELFYSFFKLSKDKSGFAYLDHYDFFHYLSCANEIIICDVKTAQQKWLEFFKAKGL